MLSLIHLSENLSLSEVPPEGWGWVGGVFFYPNNVKMFSFWGRAPVGGGGLGGG